MEIAAYLDQQLRAAGIPIIGVRVGLASDRATWSVVFDPTATQAQKDSAASLVAGTVTDAPTLADADAQSAVDMKAVKAAVLTSLFGRLGRQPTAPEISAERARYVAIYKSLP